MRPLPRWMRSRALGAAFVAALGAAAFGGCGPIAYVNQVTRDASSKVEHARALGADTLSPYWWTRAVTYLYMAREVAAHADYQGATRFGRLAAEAADKAAEEAETGSVEGVKRRAVPDLAPAKDDEAKPVDDDEPRVPKKKRKKSKAPKSTDSENP